MNGSDDQMQNTDGQPPATPMAQPPAAQAPPASAPAGQQYYAPPPPVPGVRADPRAKSPALAGFLSVMPGLGQIYTGYYTRGFVHAIVMASSISLIVHIASSRYFSGAEAFIPMVALFLAFFWFYNIIDATRRASMYNRYLEGKEEIEMPRDLNFSGLGGSLFGGLILMAVGFILLLSTRFDMSLDWIDEGWPLVPLLLGVYLFGKWIHERVSASSD